MFEHSLIDLGTRKKSRRGWFSLPVAILIHLLALATFGFASYWDVGEVPEPPIAGVFVVHMPPPPPPPIRGSGQPEQKQAAVKPPEVKPQVPEQQPVQPQDVPDAPLPVISQVAENIDASLPAGGHPDGVDEGGVEGGDPEFGVPFSHGTERIAAIVPGPAEPQPANDQPIVVGGAVLRPVPVYQPQPRYTEMARRARVQGMVVLDAVIDVNGNVVDLKVRKGQPMGLDQAALDAVRTWRFKPATLHGQPVKVYFTLTVNFQLN